VVIDMERLDLADLPVEIAISAITLAELAAGPMPPRTPPNVPAGKTVCNGPKPRSTRCRSTRTSRVRSAGFTPPWRRRGARHAADAHSIS
jgi:hypothetical protein